jgi:ergothioneine biosynthesis protein EgtB
MDYLTPLQQRFRATREQSVSACRPLAADDYCLQAEAFTSPPKWHLAHTSWFFETFILKPFARGYRTPEPLYEVLFNSYYNGVGEPFPRPRRGLLSRPTVEEVLAYRRHVDGCMLELLAQGEHPERDVIYSRSLLGIEHEQQHQELFFTDLKYALACNPLLPAYTPLPDRGPQRPAAQASANWLGFEGGLTVIGYHGGGFAFDNEGPRHRVFLEPYALACRLVTNGEYLDFMVDGGYRRPELWLADGWATLQQAGWRCPHYWLERDGQWLEYTLHGLLPLQHDQPVCHISAYEADAYARWAGARLPTEMEWEAAAAQRPVDTAGVDDGVYHPQACDDGAGLRQLYGDLWQWTSSSYQPYPGFQPAAGAIGEYNGKFMCNQLVLRGGSCVSKAEQLRPSYRNFFYPRDRWQFSGVRLARDAEA